MSEEREKGLGMLQSVAADPQLVTDKYSIISKVNLNIKIHKLAQKYNYA